MKWLRRWRREDGHPHLIIEKTLLALNNKLRQAAAFLQKKTAPYSARKMKTILALFCLLFLAGSLTVAVSGFQKEAAFPSVSAMHFIPLLKEDPPPGPVPSKALERVHRFKRYLDSLRFTESGQARRDSLLRARPHLMDTLNYLENIYTNELKNEAYGKEEPKN